MKCDDVRLSANLKQDWSGGVSLLTGGVGILESGCWSGGVMVVWGLDQRLGLGNWFELAAAAAAIQVMEVGEGAAHLNLIRILWKKKLLFCFLRVSFFVDSNSRAEVNSNSPF